MLKSSIRNKAKSIISSLFTTMGLATQNTTKVIFICTIQERERNEKGLMAREMKRNTARLRSRPTGSEPPSCCTDALDV